MLITIKLFLVYILLKNICIHSKSIEYSCRMDTDCREIDEESICLEKRCVPNLRRRRQIRFDGRMLSSTCQSNDHCRRTPVDGTKICRDNQCQCADGYVPIDSYRCIRDLEHLPSTEDKIDLNDPPGYGSLCTTSSDCQHATVQLECLRGSCVCLEGYVPLGKYLCYNIHGQNPPVIEPSTEKSKPLNSPCANDDICREMIAQSYCFEGKCACIEGYQSSDDESCIEKPQSMVTSTKSLLGGKCQREDDCQTLNAQCLNQICNCPRGSFPIDDWNCLNEQELSPSTTTSSTTNFNWWPWSSSSTSTISSRAKNFHFRCLLNRQCLHFDLNSHCKSNRCICNLGYRLDLTGKMPRCTSTPTTNDDEDCD